MFHLVPSTVYKKSDASTVARFDTATNNVFFPPTIVAALLIVGADSLLIVTSALILPLPPSRIFPVVSATVLIVVPTKPIVTFVPPLVIVPVYVLGNVIITVFSICTC